MREDFSAKVPVLPIDLPGSHAVRPETELRQTKQALEKTARDLAQQRESFQVTLSSIGDAVITSDLHNKITYLNPAAEKLTGWTLDEASGLPVETVLKIIQEGSAQPALNPLLRALKVGGEVSLPSHCALLARNGVAIPVEDKAAPIRDVEGNMAGAVMVFHDVTERRQAEDALRASNAQFAAIVNNSPLRVFLVDARLLICQANEKARQTFSPAGELVGQELAEVLRRVWPSAAEEFLGYFQSTLQTGESVFKRGFAERRPGQVEQEYFDWEIHRVTLPGGEFGVACYLIDISAYVRVQHVLMERARLAALRADISSSLSRSDELKVVLQHCAQAMVTHLDGAFARVWTVNEAENVLELQASAGLYTHLDGPHGRVPIGKFKIGRIAQFRQPLTTNDVAHDPNIGDPAWAEREGMVAFVGYPMILEERVLGVLAMFACHPLSDSIMNELAPIADGLAQWIRRRNAEDSLIKAKQELQLHAFNLERTVAQRTAQLQEKIGELEAFSYSVSHDMRSPLRAMQGYATALLKDYKGKVLDEDAWLYLERIHKAATRMDLLIQELLSYSHVTKAEMILAPIDLEKLIDDVIIGYPGLQAPAAHVKVEKGLPRVLGHEALLTQVVSNLLGNAVKFVNKDEIPEITVRAEDAGEMVKIWFEDQGIGVDPTHFKRIFEIFGRVYGDKKFEGTGIGLAIVKKAAERMGGESGVISELGHGSRFWITLKKA